MTKKKIKKSWTSFEEAVRFLEQGLPPKSNAGFLGVDLNPEECSLLLIPVPWEATTSYGAGTSKGPKAMVQASHQLDTEDSYFGKIYRAGVTFAEFPTSIQTLNASAKRNAQSIIRSYEQGKKPNAKMTAAVNEASDQVNKLLYERSKSLLEKNKFVAVVGGDHACPFGLMKALGEKYPEGYSVVHFDAHHDLREAYEGFTYSHASIFFNVMEEVPAVKQLTQVGIRDFSADEKTYMKKLNSQGRGNCFYSREIFEKKANGQTFKSICDEIIGTLSERVYISFDIDGLDPWYCPSTGTPVPGGLSYEEAVYFMEQLSKSGKKIIGFDLCEVAPGDDEWDANVGARFLYKLCGTLLRSQNKI